MESIFHTVKLTGIKPGECVVLVRDGTTHYQKLGDELGVVFRSDDCRGDE